MTGTRQAQAVVIGGGQAGLAAGYHLRRLGLDFVILDAQSAPGGAWRHGWESLRLFSPAAYSSSPGRPMPVQVGETYPDTGHAVGYLADLAHDTELTWVTRRPPRFLPDDIDGRALFDVATALPHSRLRSSGVPIAPSTKAVRTVGEWRPWETSSPYRPYARLGTPDC